MSKIFTVAAMSFIFVSAFAKADPAQTCWESLHKISPRLSSDSSCVLESAKEHFDVLCSEDGIAPTKGFAVYLTTRSKYLQAKAEADEWLAANPGSSQYPPAISAKLQNAENAWMVGGKRFQVEGQIEKLRRQSAACK